MQIGTPVRAGPTLENGYLLVYSFAPIAIPAGEAVSFTLDFAGTIRAAVGGAAGIDVANGDVISSVNVVPSGDFASSLIPGPSLGFPGSQTVSLPLVNEAYDNAGNFSIAPSGLAISISGASGPGVPADLFATPTLAAVNLFAAPGDPFAVTPAGSRAFFTGGVSHDRSSGSGTLRLTVTTVAVPEPGSAALVGAALVGAGLLGMTGWRRRRGAV